LRYDAKRTVWLRRITGRAEASGSDEYCILHDTRIAAALSRTQRMTFEDFLTTYEQAVEALPKLLDDWPTLDEDLCWEYQEQLEWLLDCRERFFNEAVLSQTERLRTVNEKMLPLAPRILAVMGVEV